MGNWFGLHHHTETETVSSEAASSQESDPENSFVTFATREINNQILRNIMDGLEESLWEEQYRSSHSSSEPESEPETIAHEPDREPENLPSEITADILSWADFIRLPVRRTSEIEF